MFEIIGPDDPALAVLAEAIKAQPEYGAGLSIIPWPEYRDRLMACLQARQAPQQAVFVPGHVWIPELAAAGLLAPLGPLIEAAAPQAVNGYDAGDLLPSVCEESGYEGQQYMLPFFSDGHILFYHSELVSFERDGVPVVAPSSLPALLESLKLPPGVSGLALKAHPSEILLDWLPYLWDAGGDLLDEAGQPAIDSEAAVQALTLYCDLRRFCPADTHKYGNAEILSVIKEGRAALVTTWGGQAAPIFKDNPNSPYRAAVFPRPWNVTWGIAIPANQPEEVQQGMLEVLLHLLGPEQDRAVTRKAGSPVRSKSYAADERSRYPWLDAQYEMLKRAGSLPRTPQTGAYLGALYEAVYAAFTGSAAPRAALTAAAAAMRAALGAE